MPAHAGSRGNAWSRWRKRRRESAQRPNAWRTAPVRTRVIFLLAVFSVFTGIGIAVDVSNLGLEPFSRVVVSVALTGLFAVAYAFAGVMLRGRFLRGIVPLLVLHILCMGLVKRWMPGPSGSAKTKLAEDGGRLSEDGVAIILFTGLGYIGLVRVSVSEARRYAAGQTEKARLESEMDAAREAQRVMVPDALPPVAGYTIDNVFRPVGEVGGDFFQLISLQSGRSLAVIGDVSGKGLRAAMVVSMIVGMLCIICRTTEEPGEILAELNRRLHGRMRGGFATCLAVRLDGGGRLVLATAGHPAPYLNGREIPLPGSMPLGMNETESYAQSSVEMQHGDVTVLLTDGIPEASNDRDGIFGFPRVESLLRDGANAKTLAEAAQEHGQNDDLTAIGISRRA
jgi:hypothetical protein